MVASILGRTAADSSFAGSSLASGASVSGVAADDAVVAAAPPVTSSLSFWFSCLNHQNENEGFSEQCRFPEFVDTLLQCQDLIWEDPIKPTLCRKHPTTATTTKSESMATSIHDKGKDFGMG